MTPEEAVEWEPVMEELRAHRGWKKIVEIAGDMRAQLVTQLTYTAVGEDIVFLRGQLIGLENFLALPTHLVNAATATREEVDELEQRRRDMRNKMGIVMGGEVSQ